MHAKYNVICEKKMYKINGTKKFFAKFVFQYLCILVYNWGVLNMACQWEKERLGFFVSAEQRFHLEIAK